jgi:transposase InsO family protein
MQRGGVAVTQDDLLYRFRLRVFAMAAELGNVRAACRAMGIHPSTYYRWKRQLDRYGPEILRPRERRAPRMANQTSVLVEQRVVAFALGHPGFGPARIAAELARPKWGAIQLSTNGVWPVLRRHGLSTRARRYGLVAGYAAPLEPARPALPERHLDVDHPGELVQLDCFCIGRLSGTKGTVWQYTAIDVASAYTWATLQVTRRNPSAHWTSALAQRVAADLAERGWRLERVMSDNASEFRSATFQATIAKLGARQSFIRAGRPQTNGCVERVQQTILDECWKPAFARYLIPKQTGLKLDLERYLRYYNTERAHSGRWTKGRTPDEVLGKAKLWQKKR